VTTALYIVLGILVVAAVALQIWIARSSAPLAGKRSGAVMFLRLFNVVLLVGAALLVAYALVSGR
jgi:membrane protein required for beta-lactamase induction